MIQTESLSLDLDSIPFSWEREVMWVMDIVHTASTAGDGYDKMQLRCPFGIWCVVVVLQRERGPGVSIRCIRWGDIIVSIYSSTHSPESSL